MISENLRHLAPAELPEPLHRAVQAVVPALPVIRRLGATLGEVPPVIKADGSPVTAADFAVQAVVVTALRQSMGGSRLPLLGEETADGLVQARRPDVEALVVEAVRQAYGWVDRAQAIAAIDGDLPRPGERTWSVDPIDGTRGFVAGAQCAVCVALTDGAEVELAVLGCPRLGPAGDRSVHAGGPGVMLAALRGGGAYECDATGASARILRPGSWHGPDLRWARSMNRSGNAVPSRLEPRIGSIGPIHDVRMDSQCKYGLVARGDADLVVRMPRGGTAECVWDHAAGALLVAESGGVATDVLGERLDFGHGARLERNAGILCARDGLHEAACAAVAPMVGRA